MIATGPESRGSSFCFDKKVLRLNQSMKAAPSSISTESCGTIPNKSPVFRFPMRRFSKINYLRDDRCFGVVRSIGSPSRLMQKKHNWWVLSAIG